MSVNTASTNDITYLERLQAMYEEIGRKLHQVNLSPTSSAPDTHNSPTHYLLSEPTSLPSNDTMVSFRNRSFLRREFKIHGGQVGDHNSDITYTSLCKQVDEGICEGFIGHAWRERYLPGQQLRPLTELLQPDETLEVFALNGEAIPYDGWVEIIVNIPGNDNPDLAIQVPFLVSQTQVERPLLGYNVIQEVISRPGGAYVLSTVAHLLKHAMAIDEEQAVAYVSLTQAKAPSTDSCNFATTRVGKQDITLPPGQTTRPVATG